MVDNYLADLAFLNKNKAQYEENFLRALSSFDSEIKNSISELLTDVANASKGLSEEEHFAIERLKNNYLL